MASTPNRNDEKRSSWLSQTASCLSGGQKVSVSHSEEFLTRISNELTEEALFIAGCHMNFVPTKEKQTRDQGTQISNHVLFTKTGGTDTCSNRNHTHTKTYHLPSLHGKPPVVPGDFFLLTFKKESGSLQIFELSFELLALWLIENVRRGNGACLRAPVSQL
ncbi:putative protein T-ENOL [Sciurus carolinensis]|uniref:putative protein T-ENOL n=1 Tax=Sciurus carolinensis TaxID=30640 RepID=UPI001FB2EB92|nr:putative protein T-ENOL [Sciurus carolinensis]XP_047390140.1 putative protein T-ENOL [Sciurus carolinensis]XP_047390141.1 putative protein T-ENOL [Sciurus carolinensis]XP_047390142.1 putative protein T-ENOL [Sciurus carolinensis]XP_047390143.1 putative protein T-ENOL [Sciurus carolinensis]